MRPIPPVLLTGLLLALSLSSLFGQTMPDSARAAVDSLRIIPCGEAIGTFYPSARVTVADTVAGWAKLYVEGWVPVESALPFLNRPRLDSAAVGFMMLGGSVSSSQKQPEIRQQCEAVTSKGKRCSRKAEKKSKFCWQHQLR